MRYVIAYRAAGRSGKPPLFLALEYMIMSFIPTLLCQTIQRAPLPGIARMITSCIMRKTYPAGAIMIREFADQMLLQHHGAVQMIDRLVAGGLVQRSYSSTDGRSVLVSLSAKGTALLETAGASACRGNC